MNTPLPDCFYEHSPAAVDRAVIVTDSDRRVLYWNATAEELYGYTAAQAVGRPLDDLIVPVPGCTVPPASAQTSHTVAAAALVEESSDWLTLSNDLHDALARDELVLHYQPVIDLATGRMRGVEALTRWHHPSHGPVSPAKFVTVAERTGLAAALDLWVLNRVRRDASELRDAMPGMYVTVNISAAHLSDPGVEDAVVSALRPGGLSAGELVLEVTESAMMDNLDQARAILERLKAHGVRSAIDDFGTGYSSLRYLNRLPASIIKIDRSFIENITEDNDALAITSSVIRLARRMRITTIAEGVETREQLTLLRQLGCNAVQGFLFSPAVSPADLPEIVARLADWDFGAELIG